MCSDGYEVLFHLSGVMSLTLLYMVIARRLNDGAISQRDSFASLGMTRARLFAGQDTSSHSGQEEEAPTAEAPHPVSGSRGGGDASTRKKVRIKD